MICYTIHLYRPHILTATSLMFESSLRDHHILVRLNKTLVMLLGYTYGICSETYISIYVSSYLLYPFTL